jgi:2-oxo-3-hexenedioate decarboxylase
MGLSTMIFGRLTDGMMVEDGGSRAHASFIHPRVEPEIAFCLKRRLVGKVTLTEAAAATDWLAPAVEIIDSRYRDFKFSLADVVADNSSSSGFAIGVAALPTLDIANLGMVLSVDGAPREIGSSAAILGNPWRSLVAAAAFAAQYDFELMPGDIVMAGGATAAVAVGAGARISLETQSLARVQFTLNGKT